MHPIPLNLRTLYEDLAQKAEISDTNPATISIRTVRNRKRLYATERTGSTYRQRYIGLADDPDAITKAEAIRRAAESAKLRRNTVSILKQARIPAPTLEMGRLLESVAKARLFERGLILIGTVAYQMYPCVVGMYLTSSAMRTQDADFAIARFAVPSLAAGEDIETVLRRADPNFKPVWHADDGNLPRRFISTKTNLEVDFVTTAGRANVGTVPIKGLNCAAVPLKFVEHLIQDPLEVVALYGAGIPVRVPNPIRYAVHKLIVAGERLKPNKHDKDLQQARELIDIFLETDDAALQDALDDARDRGKSWKTAINASLKEIGREARQGRLPFPVTTRKGVE